MAKKGSTSLFTLVGGDDQTISGQFVLKAGDTMTGLLTLSGDAVNPLNPVTFQQFNLGLVGLVPKGSVKAASDGNVNIASPASDVFDAHTVLSGERVLIQMQTLPIENGIYIFNGVGVPMTRDPLMITGSDAFGAYVSVVNGATYAGQFRICISDPAIVDTDDLIWDFQAGLVFGDGSTIDVTGNVVSLMNGGILDIHVNAAAAIDGTKISPDFGSQFVSSLGGASFETLELQNNGADTGWLALPFVSTPTPSASVTKVYADALNSLSFIGDSFYAKFVQSVFSANRTYTLPNANGTIALVPSAGFVTSVGGALSSVPAIDLGVDVTGLLPVANGGTGSNSYTAGSVIFANASQLTEDNSRFFYDDANNRLGIGLNATSPQFALQVNASAGTAYLQRDPLGVYISGSAASPTKLVVEQTFGSSTAAEVALSSRPSGAMGGFEDLGWLSFFGRDNAGNQRRGAYIRGITSGAWTSTSLPTHMDFFTVPSGSSSEIQRARLHSSGEFYVGSTGLVGSTGTLNIGPLTTAKIGLYMRAQAGQTADLIRLQDNGLTTVMQVLSGGQLFARSLTTTDTSGNGMLQLVDQSGGAPTLSSASTAIYSDGLNRPVIHNSLNRALTLDNTVLTTNRTYTLQNQDMIIANVPATIGPVKSTGSDLTAGLIDLTTEVTGVLDIGYGGTNTNSIAAGIVTSNGTALSSISFPASGVVTSNGSALSSYFRETLRTNATQSVATTTPTNLTQLTSSSLAAGTYRMNGVLVFQSTATGTGVGFRMNAVSATMSSVYGRFLVGTTGTAIFAYQQTTTATNVTSASVSSANVDFVATFEGTFTLSAPGTVAIQMRSETGTSVSIRANSFVEITAI